MDGWLKLHRQIINSSKFADPDILRLWILCLTKASHKGGIVLIDKQEVQLTAGQFVTGRYSLQQDYNEQLAPRNKVKDTTLWSWLKRLEQWGDLDIKSTNKYSVITVLKWSDYQDTLTTELQQTDNKVTTERQQTDTNKNVKKDKEVKKIYAPNITLTETEHSKLCSELGDAMAQSCILYLDSYKIEKAYKTKSDYLTIKRWVIDAVKKIPNNVKKFSKESEENIPTRAEWEEQERKRQEAMMKRAADI